MKAVFIAGAAWLAFIIVSHAINSFTTNFTPDFAIGVMVMAGVGAYLFKD